MEDVRWKQRFDNFVRAYREFSEAVALSGQRELSKLEKQGLIQSFEYTHELAWNVLKDFLTEQGISGLIGSKDTTREAFRQELINDGTVWMDMIKSRNLTSHTYDQKLADDVIARIVSDYFSELRSFFQDFTCREQSQ